MSFALRVVAAGRLAGFRSHRLGAHFTSGVSPSSGAATANAPDEETQRKAIHAFIDSLVTSHPLVLFIKGTPGRPMCGFSRQVVQALSARRVAAYESVNVLEDEAIRAGVKRYTSWPTIPQIFIGGRFVGGCDMMAEMERSGELSRLLEAAKVPLEPEENGAD